MTIIKYDEHTIEAINRIWGEYVKYAVKLMTKGFSIWSQTYHFRVSEENHPVTYDIQIKSGFPRVHINISRNGISVYNS